MRNFDWHSVSIRCEIFARHVGQSAAACLTAMTQGDLSLITPEHWKKALLTGIAAGLVGVVGSIGPLLRHYGNPWFGAAVAFAGTFVADLWSHPSHFGGPVAEALVTAAGAAVLSLLVSATPLGNRLVRWADPEHDRVRERLAPRAQPGDAERRKSGG